MANRRFFLVTWNMENTLGENAELQHIAGLVANYNADVVVAGLQEAKNGSATLGRLGNQLAGFSRAHREKMTGMTKGTFNNQAIAVFVRTADVANFELVNHDSHKAGLEGKGGLCALVQYHGVRAAFTTSHLDSKVAQKRIDQINNLRDTVQRMNLDANTRFKQQELSAGRGIPQYRHLGVDFVMGDLNYRIRMDHIQTQRVVKKKLLKTKVKEMYDQQTLRALFQDIIDPITRTAMLQQYDTLTGTSYQAAAAQFSGYSFPHPMSRNGGVSLPTYKRDRTIGVGNPCVVFNANLNNNPNDNNQIQMCEACYSGVQYNQARQEIDMGWLDRIGYKLHTGLIQVVTAPVYDIPECYSGDHAPVCMEATIND